ncbi:MAG: hypothetical protein RJA22_1637 [Verrucomicrobiota bacterium]|jgi:membrane-associated phospholipid phosphatase
MLAWLQSLDIAVFRFINDTLSCAPLDLLLPLLDGNAFFIPAVLLGLALLCWRGGGRGRLYAGLLALALLLGELTVIGPLKDLISRPRPFNALEGVHVLSGRGSNRSMPSAHTSVWFAAATVTLLYYPRAGRVLLGLAVLMAFSRVYLGVHYPSDVLAGALLGAGYVLALLAIAGAAWGRAGPRWFPLWWERLPSLVPGPGPATTPTVPPPAVSGATGADTAALRDAQWARLGVVLLVVICLARLAYLADESIQLSEDEAYQWLWSKNPALSYFSKPPLIAWGHWAGTHLWGDTTFGVRFFPPVLALVLGVVVLRFLTRLASARVALITVLLLNLTPLLCAGSLLMTVDPWLVTFWTAAMVAGWRALQPDGRTVHWLWVGLWTGLGFLSKYTALAQVGCWAVFFALHRPARGHLRRAGPWLALGIVALCSLPVLIWNAQHGWVTLAHLGDNAQVDKSWRPTTRYLLDFLGAEAGLLNPVCLGAAVISAVAFWRRYRDDERLVYLFAMGAPLFLAYTLLALRARVHPNWIAAAVVPMFCHMALYWDRRWREGAGGVKPWLMAACVYGVATVPVLHDSELVTKLTGLHLPARLDPLRRVVGIRDIARVAGRERQKLLGEGRPVFILTGHYGPAGQISFYLPEARAGLPLDPLVFCQLGARPKNQFHFWPHYRYAERRRGDNAIFVQFDDGSKPIPPAVAAQFKSVTDLGVFPIRHRKQVYHQMHLFACRELR